YLCAVAFPTTLDLRKDYSRQPGEPISAWLLRCWDNGAGRQQLEGHEAQQLGSLAKDREIERGIGKEGAICSLWRRLLSSVRARYPFKEDLVNSPGKWTTADEGIQHLRELAVLEIIYSDLKSDRVPEDPEDAPCTMAMWRKVVQSAPASYSSSLVSLYHPQMDTPTIEMASSWMEAWKIDHIGPLPQTRPGRRYILTMAEATTGWLETSPVNHCHCLRDLEIPSLEGQILRHHGTTEGIELDNGAHFKNNLINRWAKKHGIECTYHIPYYSQAPGKIESYNGLLKTM
uniref:Integrase catalytic domain-containing protein n=1 Tax=Cyanistes caeruleus TaxID=156563 RepID=A0A8C0UGE2_CYACU